MIQQFYVDQLKHMYQHYYAIKIFQIRTTTEKKALSIFFVPQRTKLLLQVSPHTSENISDFSILIFIFHFPKVSMRWDILQLSLVLDSIIFNLFSLKYFRDSTRPITINVITSFTNIIMTFKLYSCIVAYKNGQFVNTTSYCSTFLFI